MSDGYQWTSTRSTSTARREEAVTITMEDSFTVSEDRCESSSSVRDES